MVLRSLLYALGVFFLTGIIALGVAGIIKLIYLIVHMGQGKKKVEKVEPKSTSE